MESIRIFTCINLRGVETELQIRINLRKDNISKLEKMIIILLALCPILQHYKGLYVNAAVTVLLVSFPFAAFKLYKKRLISLKRMRYVAPLIVFSLFKVIDHGTTVDETGQAIIFSIIVIAISCSCFDVKYFERVVVGVSIAASLLIIVQYFHYYLFDYHLKLVPTSLLLDRSDQWVLAAETGRASISGRISKFYRPSAFFLEPSHMFIYMFMPLVLLLLSPRFNRQKSLAAVLLTVGMIFSTSGMGIMMAIGIWILFIGRDYNNKRGFSLRKILRPTSFLILFVFIAAIIFVYFRVPFFRNSMERIWGSGGDYKNAIAGRVESAFGLVSQLRGLQIIRGVGDRLTNITFNMSGFYSTMYRYGIIGTVLSYAFYLQSLARLKNRHFWICAIIIVLSFFSAHSHSTMFMIYSTFVLIQGYIENEIVDEVGDCTVSSCGYLTIRVV